MFKVKKMSIILFARDVYKMHKLLYLPKPLQTALIEELSNQIHIYNFKRFMNYGNYNFIDVPTERENWSTLWIIEIL